MAADDWRLATARRRARGGMAAPRRLALLPLLPRRRPQHHQRAHPGEPPRDVHSRSRWWRARRTCSAGTSRLAPSCSAPSRPIDARPRGSAGARRRRTQSWSTRSTTSSATSPGQRHCLLPWFLLGGADPHPTLVTQERSWSRTCHGGSFLSNTLTDVDDAPAAGGNDFGRGRDRFWAREGSILGSNREIARCYASPNLASGGGWMASEFPTSVLARLLETWFSGFLLFFTDTKWDREAVGVALRLESLENVFFCFFQKITIAI
jgi:hypothetical protein